MTSGVHVALRSEKELANVETEFQDVSIFETRHLGKMMRIDDGIQVTTRGEHIYHEMMVHVPTLVHNRVKKAQFISMAKILKTMKPAVSVVRLAFSIKT